MVLNVGGAEMDKLFVEINRELSICGQRKEFARKLINYTR